MHTLWRHTGSHLSHPRRAASRASAALSRLRSLRIHAAAEPTTPAPQPSSGSPWSPPAGSAPFGGSRSYTDGNSPPFTSGSSSPVPYGERAHGERLTSPFFGVYKGKAAMQLKMIPPTWGPCNNNFLEVQKDGAILLEFAQVAAGAGAQGGFGARSYAWDRKVMFSLKAAEANQVADALVPGPVPGPGVLAPRGVDLLHDPFKGGPDEGKTMKSFKVSPPNADGSHFFSVSQRMAGSEELRVSVPISAIEAATIRTLLLWAVPNLLGFNAVFDNVFVKR